MCPFKKLFKCGGPFKKDFLTSFCLIILYDLPPFSVQHINRYKHSISTTIYLGGKITIHVTKTPHAIAVITYQGLIISSASDSIKLGGD